MFCFVFTHEQGQILYYLRFLSTQEKENKKKRNNVNKFVSTKLLKPISLKPAITDFVATCGHRKQAVNTMLIISFKADIVTLLTNSLLFTHPVDKEQH